jgi:glycerol-3-phosphate acyltransferase PlsY
VSQSLILGASILVISYLVGSISPAYLVARLAHGVDLRRRGSGNLGTANTLEVLGPSAAALVLVGDVLKGYLPALLAPLLASALAPGPASGMPEGLAGALAAAGAVLGHCFSPWLRLRGGKGVATTAGALLALEPVTGLIAAGVFAAVVAVTRYVAFGSVMLPAVAAVLLAVRDEPRPVVVFAAGAALLVLHLHRGNLLRIREGREGKVLEGEKDDRD